MNGRLANARAITKQLLCDNFRPEAVSDVISGVDVEQGGMNVHVKFGDSRSNCSRDIRLPHFVTNDASRRRSLPKNFMVSSLIINFSVQHLRKCLLIMP